MATRVDLNRFDLVSLDEPIWLAQYVDRERKQLLMAMHLQQDKDGITGSVDLVDFSANALQAKAQSSSLHVEGAGCSTVTPQPILLHGTWE